MNKDEQFILEQCNRYLLEEPNPRLQTELQNLMTRNSPESRHDLYDRMMHDLKFGTAGVRAKMEAGYNRMNLVAVYRLSFALGIELLNDDKNHRSVIVGFDGRHQSFAFAEEVSAILRSMGMVVHLFNEPAPTPLGAYAARLLGTSAAVMVTASHNPPLDNGIKIFSGRSAQAHGKILKNIEARMKEAPLRFEFHHEQIENLGDKNLHRIGDDVFYSYLQEITTTQFLPNQRVNRDVKIAYTPLHGVGKKYFLEALLQEGFQNVVVVAEQAEPDGSFATVDFPNPEEAHTLDLAHRLGSAERCDAVMANDPDADRLQVSCPDKMGVMKKLSGNEIGVILGYFAILRAREMNTKPLVASSIVSSRMLKAMSAQLGARYVDALTGFSNIVESATSKASEHDAQLVFAYEEAIGFLIGRVVLDKDGVHAGVRFMEILGALKEKGETIWQLLDELYLKYGLFVSTSWSWRFDGAESMTNMQKVMQKVRAVNPFSVAQLLGQSECEKFDLLEQQKNNSYEGLRSDVVIFEIELGGRIIVRPSGTEPKIKFYVELWDHATDHQMLSNKKTKLSEMIVVLKTDLERLFE